MDIRKDSESGAGEKKLKGRAAATKKKKRFEDESIKERAEEATVRDVDDDNDAGDENAEEDDEGSDEHAEEDDNPPEGLKSDKTRHIRPCICDLSEKAIQRVAEYRLARKVLRDKYTLRRAEIEEELRQKEEEAKQRQREKEEQQELFGDEYTLQDGQRKRKKRSARRASMVSLGVRQVINWKKEPKVKVVFTKTWHLRHDNTLYCGRKKYYLPPIEYIDFRKPPLVPVRLTRTYEVRHDFNVSIKNKLIESEDKRPRFVLQYISPSG
jgi:hypothetical protein